MDMIVPPGGDAQDDVECICEVLPEKYHYVYYGITEPGSMWDWNPECPAHPPAEEWMTTFPPVDAVDYEGVRRPAGGA